MAVDLGGNLYIADASDHRVLRVSRKGQVITVAGEEGRDGFFGDGGPAIRARLHSPAGVAVDALGNLLIADTDNERIRRVDRRGQIATIAGNGKRGFSGDGKHATRARLASPEGIAMDTQGNFYIADRDNNRIRRISPGGIITTFAGTGKDKFSGDGGPAANAELNHPRDVAVDADQNVYFTDLLNLDPPNNIRIILKDQKITLAKIETRGPGRSSSAGNVSRYAPRPDRPGHLSAITL